MISELLLFIFIFLCRYNPSHCLSATVKLQVVRTKLAIPNNLHNFVIDSSYYRSHNFNNIIPQRSEYTPSIGLKSNQHYGLRLQPQNSWRISIRFSCFYDWSNSFQFRRLFYVEKSFLSSWVQVVIGYSFFLIGFSRSYILFQCRNSLTKIRAVIYLLYFKRCSHYIRSRIRMRPPDEIRNFLTDSPFLLNSAVKYYASMYFSELSSRVNVRALTFGPGYSSDNAGDGPGTDKDNDFLSDLFDQLEEPIISSKSFSIGSRDDLETLCFGDESQSDPVSDLALFERQTAGHLRTIQEDYCYLCDDHQKWPDTERESDSEDDLLAFDADEDDDPDDGLADRFSTPTSLRTEDDDPDDGLADRFSTPTPLRTESINQELKSNSRNQPFVDLSDFSCSNHCRYCIKLYIYFLILTSS